MLPNIAHVIGLIALIFMIISFQTKKQAKLLKFQIISSLFFAIQYFLLNAMSGFFIFLFTTIRNVVFSRYKDKKVPMFLIIIYLSIVILFSYASYTNIYSIIPGISSILFTLALYSKNMKTIRIIDVIICVINILYNFNVKAYTSLISCILEMLSSIIGIIRFDIKNKN